MHNPPTGINAGKRMRFVKPIMVLALPVALQSILGIAVNLIDTVMLGSLGEVAISASALGNQLFIILSLIVYGIVGGSNVLVAQFWGQRDSDSINRVLAYTYRIGLGAAMLFTAAGLAFPSEVLSIFTTDAEVIAEGAPYLRSVSISYVMYTLTAITYGTLRSVRDVKISVVLSAVSLALNAALNWLLIFGNLGAPRLGTLGAGITTSIARAVEFALILLYVAFRENRLHIRIPKLLRLDRALGRRFASITVPVMLNELFWSVGASVLTIIIGRMGTEFVAANSIAGVANQIAGVMAQGLSAAAAVMVGNCIGAGQFEELRALKRQLQWVGIFAGIATMLLILLMRPIMLSIYNVSETTLHYTNQIMYVGAGIMMFRTAQVVNMMGILRGGGDAKFVMINDLAFLWGLAVPLGFLAGLVWKWPIPVVYCILNIEQIFKLFVSAWRLRSDRWIKNVTAA